MDRKALREVKRFVARVKKDYRIVKAIFFGSRTGKDWLRDSDVDVILVSPDFRGIFFTDRMSRMYAYWKSKYALEVLCYTPEEFEKKSKQISIVKEALRKGIEIT